MDSKNPEVAGELPQLVDITPNHIGALGEALFNAKTLPPEPIPDRIRAFCRDEAPDWVRTEALSIYRRDFDDRFEEQIGDTVRWWEPDSMIEAWYDADFDSINSIEDGRDICVEYGNSKWEYRFPVEIKTGTSAELGYNNQRKLMKSLATKDEIQPMYVHLRIDTLPCEYIVDEIRFGGL